MSSFTIPIKHHIEVPASVTRQEKEIKGIQIGKQRKTSLFTDDIIHNRTTRTEKKKELLELINEFCTFAGYKINIPKSIVY